MSNQGKTSKIKEIKDSVFGVVEIIRQIRTPVMLESFNKIVDMSHVAEEIIEALKSPEMVKNIENFRLISENFNEASTKIQGTIKHLEETGVLNEAVDLVESARGAMKFVGEAGQDFREISVAIKEIFHSIRTAQNKVQTVSEKYHKTERSPNNVVMIPDEIVITPDEIEYYRRFGWNYLATLPNGKMIVRNSKGLDW